jgi:hypothetical protein
LSCSKLIANYNIVLPTLNVNPTSFVVPCKIKKDWGIKDLQCCN